MTYIEVRNWLLENKLFEQKGQVKRYFVKMDYLELLKSTKENNLSITQIREILADRYGITTRTVRGITNS